MVDEIVQYIVSAVSDWASRMPAFVGIPLDDLNRSWASSFSGGRHFKLWIILVGIPHQKVV